MQLGNLVKYTNAPVFSELGDGSTKSFTLGFNPGTKNALLVFVGGTFQSPAAYELDFNQSTQTTKIIFTPAPGAGARVVAVGLGIRGIAGIPADGSVTSKSLNRSGVGLPDGSTCATQATSDTSDRVSNSSFVSNVVSTHNNSVRPHGMSDIGHQVVKASTVESIRSILGIAAESNMNDLVRRLGVAEEDISVLQGDYVSQGSVDDYILAKVNAMMAAHAFDSLIKNVSGAGANSIIGSIVYLAWNPVGPQDLRPLSPGPECSRQYNGKDVYIQADGRSFNAAVYPELAAKIPSLKVAPMVIRNATDNGKWSSVRDTQYYSGTLAYVPYVIAVEVPGWKAEFKADIGRGSKFDTLLPYGTIHFED